MTRFDTTWCAQQLMTLSAIAYVEPSAQSVHPTAADISGQLQGHPRYATANHWSLVWGPGFTETDDNMFFLAQYRDEPVYAVVIRGTVGRIASWDEDLPTAMAPFPPDHPAPAPLVSDKFAHAIGEMAATAVNDPNGQPQTLLAYLLSVTATHPSRIYVTGHSQGGGLAPMMAAYLAQAMRGSVRPPQIAFYAFAPPTPGDKRFADYVDSACPNSRYVANPNDIVPRGYGDIASITRDDIPTDPGEVLGAIIDIAADAMTDLCADWAHPGAPIPVTGQSAPAAQDFEAQAETQHNHNSYLVLLGATQTQIGDYSPFVPPAEG